MAVIVPCAPVFLSGTAAASPQTCTWTGATNDDWSTSTNWSGCGGGVPQNGDNLVFDVSSLSTPTQGNLVNSLSNLQVGSITFTGSNIFSGYGYILSGNPISLSGGIHDGADTINNLEMDITLTADQTFTRSHSGYLVPDSATLDIGNHTLTLDSSSSGGSIDIYDAITGTGKIVSKSGSYANFFDNNNPGLSGPIDIQAGRLIINANQTDQLGTGPVTVEDGATLQESINANGNYTVNNPITLAGNGRGSYGTIHVEGFSATGTVSFTGNILLNGNVSVGLVGADAVIAGPVSGCGYTISPLAGNSGTLSGNLAGSCAVPGAAPGSSTNTANVPGAPNTGYGGPDNDHLPLMLLVSSAAILAVGVYFRFKFSQTS